MELLAMICMCTTIGLAFLPYIVLLIILIDFLMIKE